jgi:hypothetical protein
VSEPTNAFGWAVTAATSIGCSPPQADKIRTVKPRIKIVARAFAFIFSSLVIENASKFMIVLAVNY